MSDNRVEIFMLRNLRSLLSGRIAFLMLALTCLTASAQMNAPDSTSSDLQESAQSKIARALSAGPPNVTKNATVADMDAKGQMKVLRLGTNDFTCLPGDPNTIGLPPMCEDKVAMQWNHDFAEHKAKPTTNAPGVEYLLAGATQRSDSDPFDKTAAPIRIGPHWMIL